MKLPSVLDSSAELDPYLANPFYQGWDFAKAQPHPLASVHPYPAKFIPDIPRRLIEEFRPARGCKIYDPFCGSGTALVEAQTAGLHSLGVDLNPIAVLISRVTTGYCPVDLEAVLEQVVGQARDARNPAVPDIPRLDHWFMPHVQSALAALVAAISAAPDHARDILRLGLSAIVVRVSNQESDTRYAAVKKDVSSNDVFSFYHRSVQKIIARVSSKDRAETPALVMEANALNVTRDEVGNDIGLVVTSPPYPNAYEYWLYHKYRMYWLGHDPQAVKDSEIGARAHFFGGNRHNAQTFHTQMDVLLRNIRGMTRPSAHVCFVVGRSRIHGVEIDNAETLALIGPSHGFREVARVQRTISRTRKSFNLSHAAIKNETILILRRI